MNAASLVWGSPAWGWSALALAGVGIVLVAAGYWHAASSSRVRLIAGVLKAIGIGGLALCLIEPLLSSTRARSGANMFAIVADNSQSMTIHDRGAAESRGQALQSLLSSDSHWQQRLADDFDARRFAFDAQLH